MTRSADPHEMRRMQESWARFKDAQRRSARMRCVAPPSLCELELKYLKEVLFEAVWLAEQARDVERLRALLEWREMFRQAEEPPWVEDAREWLRLYDARAAVAT